MHMFGYIRPLREELLIREFNYYRSIYCGICKTIGREYGQIPRLGITYDLAFYALFIMCFSPSEGEIEREHCIVHPVTKRPIMSEHEILELAADLTVMLAYFKGQDDRQDQKKLQGASIQMVYRRAFRKASHKHPQLAQFISDKLAELNAIEKQSYTLPEELSTPMVATVFGDLMGELVVYAIYDFLKLEGLFDLRTVFQRFGQNIGAWIYLIDAIDDYPRDRSKGESNYYVAVAKDFEQALQLADFDLQNIEKTLDRIAALLPYRVNGSIVHNFICGGLPDMRAKVLSKLASRHTESEKDKRGTMTAR